MIRVYHRDVGLRLHDLGRLEVVGLRGSGFPRAVDVLSRFPVPLGHRGNRSWDW